MSKYKVFETERLILKPTSEEDAEFFFELQNNPTWIKYIGDRNIKNAEDARKNIISKIIPQQEKQGYANYTIIRKSDHSKIGSCGLLHNREGIGGVVDIGFAFLPKYHKKGYAYEAAYKVKHISFDEFGIKELYAITTKDNISSQKLLEKLGLKLIETITLHNAVEVSLLYKTDYKKVNYNEHL